MTDGRVAAVTAAVLRVEPHLDPNGVRLVVERSARSNQQRNRLAAHLAEHPDGLVSGVGGPPALSRIIDGVRALGGSAVVPAHCRDCGTEKRLPYVVEGGRICTPCFMKNHAEVCSRCGHEKPVIVRDAGGPVCANCHQNDPAVHEPCSVCGRRERVCRRTEKGPICPSCYERPPARCDGCGRDAPIHSHKSGRSLCDQCYESPPRQCGVCGEVARIIVREAGEGTVDICIACYEQPVVQCIGCGRIRCCSTRTAEGPRCVACSPRLLRRCVRCGRSRPAQRIDAEGPVCSGCYDHVHRVPCVRCQQPCRPYEKGRCSRCVLRQRLTAMFGEDRPDLAPLAEALVGVDDPRAVLNWLLRSKGADLLAQVIAGKIPLSHEALDQLERSHVVEHLRGLFVASGLLPQGPVHYDRLAGWLDDLLVNARPEHGRVVRPFATWCVFRRARRKAERDQLTEGGAKWARSRVRHALRFLMWLEDHDIDLGDLRQEDVDLWFASGPTTRHLATPFLSWAAGRRLVPPIEVPARQVRNAVEAVDDDERWEVVSRLLSGEETDVAVRVAGLFALLYGQHLSRVVRMRRTAVSQVEGQVFVRFGADNVRLPPVFDMLVLRLLERRGKAAVHSGDWLFSGGIPGRPMSVEAMRLRLADAGIVLRSARRAALLQLAAEIPAPVLADLLGVHPLTGVAWVRAARGDWAAYAAAGPSGSTVP